MNIEEERLRDLVAREARKLYADTPGFSEHEESFVAMWRTAPMGIVLTTLVLAKLRKEDFMQVLRLYIVFSLKGFLCGVEVAGKGVAE